MIEQILAAYKASKYDFRETANAEDPLSHLFEQWVPYYRMKCAIATVLKPKRILEIGVRYGYGAYAFLAPDKNAEYLGIDIDSDSFGGDQGAVHWAKQQLENYPNASLLTADSQTLEPLPGGPYDLVHVDGQQDGDGTFFDIRKAIDVSNWVLVDGCFWTDENRMACFAALESAGHAVEWALVIPGYAGELLIKTRPSARAGEATHSSAVLDQFNAEYYLTGLEGHGSFHTYGGRYQEENRVQAVLDVAGVDKSLAVLDAGCGRGEISLGLSRAGAKVTGLDYAGPAIDLAQKSADSSRLKSVPQFAHDDVANLKNFGTFDRIVAADLIQFLGAAELDMFLQSVSEQLNELGQFVVQVSNNPWVGQYSYGHQRRAIRRLGGYLPPFIEKPSSGPASVSCLAPTDLKRLLEKHFDSSLVWLAGDSVGQYLCEPMPLSTARVLPAIYGVASNTELSREDIKGRLTQHALGTELLTLLQIDADVQEFHAVASTVACFDFTITNGSRGRVSSNPPHPIHLSYQLFTEAGERVVEAGRRTRLLPGLNPHEARQVVLLVDVPHSPGRYVLRATFVQEMVCWVNKLDGGACCDVELVVSAN